MFLPSPHQTSRYNVKGVLGPSTRAGSKRDHIEATLSLPILPMFYSYIPASSFVTSIPFQECNITKDSKITTFIQSMLSLYRVITRGKSVLEACLHKVQVPFCLEKYPVKSNNNKRKKGVLPII